MERKQKNAKKAALAMSFLLLVGASLPAQEFKPRFLFAPTSLGIAALGVRIGVQNLEILPGAPSIAEAWLYGGYLPSSYWRDAEGGRLDPGDAGFKGRTSFWTWQARLSVGLNLGLLYSDEREKNALSLDAYYNMRFRKNIDNGAFIFYSTEANRAGFWENSFFLGINIDLTKADDDKALMHGLRSSVSAEWAPGWDWNRTFGQADYVRLDGSFQGYLPIVSSGAFCCCVADRFIADGLFGSAIPYDQRCVANVGPYAYGAQLSATGWAVRGIAAGRFDSNLKLINNIDVRFTFPSLFGRVCIPEIAPFFDMAACDDLDNRPRFGKDGIYTTGIGAYLHFTIKELFGLKDIPILAGYTACYDITEDRFSLLNFSIGSRYGSF
jgi:hypothetical protein